MGTLLKGTVVNVMENENHYVGPILTVRYDDYEIYAANAPLTKAGFRAGERVVTIPLEVFVRLLRNVSDKCILSFWD